MNNQDESNTMSQRAAPASHPSCGSLAPANEERFHSPQSAAICSPEPEPAERRRVSVLECASPLALSTTHDFQSARGLAHSKTLRRYERFMGSFLFRLDLLTGHEPDSVCPAMSEAVWPFRPMVPCARRVDWFRWQTSAHFGEARVGFPVGKICLPQNAIGLRTPLSTERKI